MGPDRFIATTAGVEVGRVAAWGPRARRASGGGMQWQMGRGLDVI